MGKDRGGKGWGGKDLVGKRPRGEKTGVEKTGESTGHVRVLYWVYSHFHEETFDNSRPKLNHSKSHSSNKQVKNHESEI